MDRRVLARTVQISDIVEDLLLLYKHDRPESIAGLGLVRSLGLIKTVSFSGETLKQIYSYILNEGEESVQLNQPLTIAEVKEMLNSKYSNLFLDLLTLITDLDEDIQFFLLCNHPSLLFYSKHVSHNALLKYIDSILVCNTKRDLSEFETILSIFYSPALKDPLIELVTKNKDMDLIKFFARATLFSEDLHLSLIENLRQDPKFSPNLEFITNWYPFDQAYKIWKDEHNSNPSEETELLFKNLAKRIRSNEQGMSQITKLELFDLIYDQTVNKSQNFSINMLNILRSVVDSRREEIATLFRYCVESNQPLLKNQILSIYNSFPADIEDILVSEPTERLGAISAHKRWKLSNVASEKILLRSYEEDSRSIRVQFKDYAIIRAGKADTIFLNRALDNARNIATEDLFSDPIKTHYDDVFKLSLITLLKDKAIEVKGLSKLPKEYLEKICQSVISEELTQQTQTLEGLDLSHKEILLRRDPSLYYRIFKNFGFSSEEFQELFKNLEVYEKAELVRCTNFPPELYKLALYNSEERISSSFASRTDHKEDLIIEYLSSEVYGKQSNTAKALIKQAILFNSQKLNEIIEEQLSSKNMDAVDTVLLYSENQKHLTEALNVYRENGTNTAYLMYVLSERFNFMPFETLLDTCFDMDKRICNMGYSPLSLFGNPSAYITSPAHAKELFDRLLSRIDTLGISSDAFLKSRGIDDRIFLNSREFLNENIDSIIEFLRRADDKNIMLHNSSKLIIRNYTSNDSVPNESIDKLLSAASDLKLDEHIIINELLTFHKLSDNQIHYLSEYKIGSFTEARLIDLLNLLYNQYPYESNLTHKLSILKELQRRDMMNIDNLGEEAIDFLPTIKQAICQNIEPIYGNLVYLMSAEKIFQLILDEKIVFGVEK